MNEELKSAVLHISYGVKVKIKYNDDKKHALLSFHPNNNFFLEFVSPIKKNRILKQIFIPYIINFKLKAHKQQIKVRTSNYDEHFYIIKKNNKSLKATLKSLEILVEYVKEIKYAVYGWRNMAYNAFFEMKLYKKKIGKFKKKSFKFIRKNMKANLESLSTNEKSSFVDKNDTIRHLLDYPDQRTYSDEDKKRYNQMIWC